MKKYFIFPVVDLISFQSEDIICTSGAGAFYGEEVGNLNGVINGQDDGVDLPMIPIV